MPDGILCRGLDRMHEHLADQEQVTLADLLLAEAHEPAPGWCAMLTPCALCTRSALSPMACATTMASCGMSQLAKWWRGGPNQ